MPDSAAHIHEHATDAERETLYLAEQLGIIEERARGGFSEGVIRLSTPTCPIPDVLPPAMERRKIINFVRYELGHKNAESMDWPELADVLRAELKQRRDAETADNRTASVDPKPPAWERLEIILHVGGNDIARLDGAEHRLKSGATAFLSAMKEKQGSMVPGERLKELCGDRPATIYETLAPELQAIIDKPGSGWLGYRML